MTRLAKILNHENYASFDQLDGQHPWMKIMPQGYVPYRVRELRQGQVTYFNFPLAKEMGLISNSHPQVMTPELQSKLVQTFSLQIINEYDELSQRRIDPTTIRPHKYMASRYLQLQHSNKQGKTSGDGRGIWNGIVEFQGKTWDVSSRGTGVTCLAPGAVQANRPLKTGAAEFGYGCGQAELDELYGAAILAEIMHLQGIKTERVLCIIDLGKGYGIGVRAAPNLLRPAHLFMYLKQNRFEELKAGMDYLIQRQIQNGEWKIKSRGKSKYDEVAELISKDFAFFTAQLDIDYIFAWLDWDGDNVLANAGIIDYGSVRQFGVRHDKYRYDDVERFSTNLNEQRSKAKLLVQVFAQICDYLKTGVRKPLKSFSQHSAVQMFNPHFCEFRSQRLLYRMGFNEVQRQRILQKKNLFEKFDRVFSYFERAKIRGSTQKVADGVNHPALFNMRAILRALPVYYRHGGLDQDFPAQQFYRTMLSGFAKYKDLRMGEKHERQIRRFQSLYKQLILVAAGKQSPKELLNGICQRSQKLCREDRITGNALINIVDEILTHEKKGMPSSQIQNIIDQLILQHLDYPEVSTSKHYERRPRLMKHLDLFDRINHWVEYYKHDI